MSPIIGHVENKNQRNSIKNSLFVLFLLLAGIMMIGFINPKTEKPISTSNASSIGIVQLIDNNIKYLPYTHFIYSYSSKTNTACDSYRFSSSTINSITNSENTSFTNLETIRISEKMRIVAKADSTSTFEEKLRYNIHDNNGDLISDRNTVADLTGKPGLYYLVSEKKWTSPDGSYDGYQYIFKIEVQ